LRSVVYQERKRDLVREIQMQDCGVASPMGAQELKVHERETQTKGAQAMVIQTEDHQTVYQGRDHGDVEDKEEAEGSLRALVCLDKTQGSFSLRGLYSLQLLHVQ
jgi:hypothetical protein